MVQEGELALKETDHPIAAMDCRVDSDTVAEQPETLYGIILTPPPSPAPAPLRHSGSLGVSFILTGLFILFLIIGLRFRNNYKYLFAIFRNLIETRTRHNVFDDTVNETSLIVLLNVLWCICAGIIGFCFFQNYYPDVTEWQYRSIGMLFGIGIAGIYLFFMWVCYTAIGLIFSDKEHAELWVKGFSASQALVAPAFFVISLIVICQPATSFEGGLTAAVFFILAKLVFIWKGYRIFFNQFSSWVLFLCYLCSLEIVPLFLCSRFAVLLSEVL